jgi:hypothetical protein
MRRSLAIFLLISLTTGLLPAGGYTVRYPSLDHLLESIERKFPASAKDIRSHTTPQSMCGVKPVVEKKDAALNGSSTSLTAAHPALPLVAFNLTPSLTNHPLQKDSLPSSPLVVLSSVVPPPRLLV